MIFRREIERKFTIQDGVSFGLAFEYLATLLPNAVIDSDWSRDVFWEIPGVDFIRLRENTRELTVKITDKGTIVDRVEENLIVEDFHDSLRWATAAFGSPSGALNKHYHVFTMPDYVVSLYRVEGVDAMFLEVEAPNLATVDEVCVEMAKRFSLHAESRSLFQIVFGEAQ